MLRGSLLGYILFSLLFETGSSFLIGGLIRQEQCYNIAVGQTLSMLLLLAITGLVTPTVTHLATNTTPEDIAAQSRGTAIISIFSYILYLVFSLKTHRAMLNAPSQKNPTLRPAPISQGQASRGIAMIGATAACRVTKPHFITSVYEIDDKATDKSKISITCTTVTIVICVILLGIHTQFATDGMQGVLERRQMSIAFLGVAIFPLLNFDPCPISLAMRDEMTMSIVLTLEKCMQTILLTVPLLVILAWCMGIDEMTLEFHSLSVTTAFVSVLIVGYVVQHGKSHW